MERLVTKGTFLLPLSEVRRSSRQRGWKDRVETAVVKSALCTRQGLYNHELTAPVISATGHL